VGGDGLVVVADLEGAEAVVTDVQSLGRVDARALPTAERFDESHELPPHRSGIGTWWDRPTGCRGFVGPVPPPLWMIGLHETRHRPDFQSGGSDSRSRGPVCLALAPTCRPPQSARSTIASFPSTAWWTPRAITASRSA